MKVNLALQWSPCIFEKLQTGPCLQPPAPPSLCFSLRLTAAFVGHFPEPQLPRATLLCATCPSSAAPAAHPTRAGPLLDAPRRAAAPRALRAHRLASSSSHSPCLLLDLKHIPELPTDSLLHSRTPILLLFLLSERHASPELRRSSCPPSSAASAASHPRFSAPVALPQPTEAHRPIQFHFPALEQPRP
jgi:hypothetical protein